MTKKLSLSTETLRKLADAEAGQVQGGRWISALTNCPCNVGTLTCNSAAIVCQIK